MLVTYYRELKTNEIGADSNSVTFISYFVKIGKSYEKLKERRHTDNMHIL
jgi:hypothetical protein